MYFLFILGNGLYILSNYMGHKLYMAMTLTITLYVLDEFEKLP